MFDMKKICLFLIIISLLVPVSSFAYDGGYPPESIIPNLTYDNHYALYWRGSLTPTFIELDGIAYHIETSDGLRLAFNCAGKRWDYINGNWIIGQNFYESGSGYNSFDSFEMIYANIDIPFGFYNYETQKLESLDEGYFFRRTDLDFLADVNIVTPPSGVHDTLSEMLFNISTEFNKLLTSDEIKSIDYKFYINGDKKNILKKLNEAFLPLSVKDRSTHILSFEIMVPIGENFCEIIYYNDEGIEIGYGSVEFERLAGFIDADGDGKDDRTGRTSGIRYSREDIATIDKPIKPDDDATAIDWLKYLGEYVGYIFEVFLNSISNFAKNVVSGIGSILGLAEPMFGFIGQFFSSMPVEIRTGFIAMFSVSAFLVIMKMIRG